MMLRDKQQDPPGAYCHRCGAELLTVKEHTICAMLLWLEWRAKQPDNPNPERTLEILRGIRHDKAV